MCIYWSKFPACAFISVKDNLPYLARTPKQEIQPDRRALVQSLAEVEAEK